MTKQLDDITPAQLKGLKRGSQYSDQSELIKAGLSLFFKSYNHYQRYGFICQSMHQQLIAFYCQTNGSLYDAIQELLAIFLPSSMCGDDHVNRLLTQLQQDGYTEATQLFTLEESDFILSQAMQMPAQALMPDGHYQHINQSDFLPGQRKPVLVNIGMDSLMANTRIKQLLNRTTVLQEVIQRTFAYNMNLVSGRLCLSYPTIESLKHEAAQSWHFDLDGIGFVKQFIYLNQVDRRNGHHVYIPGTHRAGVKSDLLLTRNYVRINDHDMRLHQRGRPAYVDGSAGTGFLGSTLCWHKGGTIFSGFRAMIIMEYSVSRFQLDVKPCCSERFRAKIKQSLNLSSSFY